MYLINKKIFWLNYPKNINKFSIYADNWQLVGRKNVMFEIIIMALQISFKYILFLKRGKDV